MTPLEKAARAACAEFYSPEHGADIDFLSKEWGPIARAVLMAVREPDDELLTAIQCARLSDKAKAATNTFARMNASTEAMWQAGIDAILSEGQT